MIIVFKFTNNPGFGDNLRGLITVLQIQKQMNFELIVNLKESVLSKYFEYVTPDIKPERSIQVPSKLIHRKDHGCAIMDIINEVSKSCRIIELSTNAYPRTQEIDDTIKNYIKQLLKLNPATKEYLENKMKHLPHKYNLIHYRFGDECLDGTPVDDRWIEHFRANKKEKSVLISDSLDFKQKINSIFNTYNNTEVFVFLDKPNHTNSRRRDYLDTISDFSMVQHAGSVCAFRLSGSVSNFVFWTAFVYDVPFTSI